MEWLNQILPEKYLFALGWMLVHAIWQIGGIGLLLWATFRMTQQKTSAYRYAMGLVALLLITLTSIATLAYYLKDSPIQYSHRAQTENHEVLTHGWISNQDLPSWDEKFTAWDQFHANIAPWIPFLVKLWIFGALLFMVKLGGSLADLRYLRLKYHPKASKPWQQVLNKLSAQLKLSCHVQLLESTHVDLPLTYGLFKPVILIPLGLFFHLSPSQLEAIIAHELAHVKRNDFLINLIQSLLEVIYFFHPVFWWINKKIREERENSCDDMAIKIGIAPKDLAYGLANTLNQAHHKAPDMAMTAVKSSHPTLDRIKRIMGMKTTQHYPTTLNLMTMMIALLLSATLFVSANRSDLVDLNDAIQPFQLEEVHASWDKDRVYQLINEEIENQMMVSDTSKLGKEVDFVFIQNEANGESDSLKRNTKKYMIIRGDTLETNDGKIVEWNYSGSDLEGFEFKAFDFAEAPEFPMGALTPLPPMTAWEDMPKLELNDAVFYQFFADTSNKGAFDFKIFKMDSALNKAQVNAMVLRRDTSKMSKEEIAQMKLKIKENLAKTQEERNALKQYWLEYSENMTEEMRIKQQELQESLQPKIIEFQKQMKEWQKNNEPQIEAYKESMKVWQEENQPKIEAFQKQMEEWQQENQEQIKAFQKKMEEWQKNNQVQLQELQQLIEEKVKKGDN
ncbi:M56 family metallopeptidase [Pararhodonellum marinum]|uniref:M56 family metallopeptidase n=1 Tax=Pararhodonellum marinum TaxID=2755358 RepID=UPI00188E37FB|nr:M56 family metallopeptidase [Pararhodonellum marinum]